jgi:Mg-chelatase subunit ChlD
MSRFRPWAFWRRLQYAAGSSLFLIFVGLGVYFLHFYTAPGCFDGIQNGNERGVDCGGPCIRICADDVVLPRVVWVESFRIVDGQYNAVAYVENRNETAATPALHYTFRLFDGDVEIASRSGTTILPPGSIYPIFEGRILTENNRIPTETRIDIAPIEIWQPAVIGRDQFRVADLSLSDADARPRLAASIENLELVDARNVEVVATIFNAAGEPLTASQTFVDLIPGRSVHETVFTWPEPIAKTVRSCDIPSDIMVVLDRSGSMAADGGVPPEPLESAKRAAVDFVRLLRPSDLVGYLSYATTPTTPIERTLTNDKAAVVDAIEATVMGRDGVQYTNIGAAINAAQAELTSVRHRDDARKVIVFLTDGDVTRPVNPQTGRADRAHAAAYARAAAEAAKAGNTTIYTIGFGDFFKAPSEVVLRDVALIRDLASSPDHYFEAPTIGELKRVYSAIATAICEDGPARIDVIPKTDTNFTPLR